VAEREARKRAELKRLHKARRIPHAIGPYPGTVQLVGPGACRAATIYALYAAYLPCSLAARWQLCTHVGWCRLKMLDLY
jgi:hypothetical protein